MRKRYYQWLVGLLLLGSSAAMAQSPSSVAGRVYDKQTQKGIDRAEIRLADPQTALEQAQSNAQGNYQLGVQPTQGSYTVEVQAQGYNSAVVAVQFSPENPVFEINFGLDRLAGNPDLGLTFGPIYFDFDSSYLTGEAILELHKIIAVLKQQPDLKIAVDAHTDSRGSSPYNDWLSKRRAARTAAYIVEKGGIASDRVQTRSHGKHQLTNQCQEGVHCTKKEHRMNRRATFAVVE